MASIASKFKIVLLGDKDVGKTSIILRYIHNDFREDTTFTPLSEETKKININGRDVNLEIWDTAGQEKYKSLETHFFRDADAAILVYSVVDNDSFENLCDYWSKETQRYIHDDEDTMPLLVVGNKVDLAGTESELVDLSSVTEYTTAFGLPSPIQVSAKTGENVSTVFNSIATELYKRYIHGRGSQADGGRRSNGSSCCGSKKEVESNEGLTVH